MTDRPTASPLSGPGMRVVLTRIYHGSKAQKRDHVIYATLVDAHSGHTVITATLLYILDAVQDRGFVLVKEVDASARVSAPVLTALPDLREVVGQLDLSRPAA